MMISKISFSHSDEYLNQSQLVVVLYSPMSLAFLEATCLYPAYSSRELLIFIGDCELFLIYGSLDCFMTGKSTDLSTDVVD